VLYEALNRPVQHLWKLSRVFIPRATSRALEDDEHIGAVSIATHRGTAGIRACGDRILG
jgi:hypothetical protein